jgi:ring-1,2-phenylacetyl-CoA epoxidase subunit PaaE
MFHSLKIKNIKQETPECVSIEFDVPKELLNEFSFCAGQFLTLKKEINGEENIRSYSLCSTPKSGLFKVAIKQIPNGKFSGFANKHLKVGDYIEVSKPNGNFFLKPESKNNKSYTLIAAGSGITPMMSILKTILNEEPSSNVHLFYGNKTPDLTIFKEELEEMKAENETRFHLNFIFSRTKGESRFNSGRIEGRKLKKIFKKFAPIQETSEVFICGPQELTISVKELLTKKFNFNPNSINFELFTTTIESKNAPSKSSKGGSSVTATIDGETVTFSIKKNQSILEAGLAAGHDVPFSCQGGVCGVCKCVKGSGEIEMDNNMVLSEEEIESGEMLACQAKVISDHINVSFDV